MIRPIRLSAVLILLAALTACDHSDRHVNTAFRGLRVIDDQDTFTSAMRDALVNQYDRYGYYGNGIEVNADAPVPPSVPDFSTSAASAPGVDTPSADGRDVTTTNIQEIGVDEADRVKSDGQFLYVLDSASRDWVGPVGVPEIDPTGIINVLQPTDAFTIGDSENTTFDAIAPYYPEILTRIRILSLDPEVANATLIKQLTLEIGNELANGLYLHQGEGSNSLIVISSSFGGYWGYWDSSAQFMGQTSSIRRIDIAQPASADLTESLTLQGQIISTRLVGDYLYVASRFFPQLQGIEPYLTDEATARAVIGSAAVDDLLPKISRASDNTVEALVGSKDCFVTQRPDNGYYTPDIVTLTAINLVNMSVSDSVCYLGATETLYATPESIYLATTRYEYRFVDGRVVSPLGAADLAPERDPRIDTDIHQFAIEDGQLSYTGSGTVEGHLGWNELQKPFRMSEHNGYLRVATYSDTQTGAVSPVLVSVLKSDEDGQLEVVSSLPNAAHPAPIGKPREQLHASRFLGDKAYLVTFLQTDPLYVVDLSSPEDPFISGELRVDGYSDYLHPIDGDFVLGIGKGAIPATISAPEVERGAFAQGVKVSLFDVSNAEGPIEVNSIEIGKRGTQSMALQDHHGITIQPATADHPTRLTFGIDVNDIPNANSDGPAGWYDWSRTGLHAFEIQTGINAGISEHGSMIVETRSDQQNWGPLRYNDRSVIVNDAVFYIHGELVFAAPWNSLESISGPE